MARPEIERLVGKAVIEPEFLRALLEDPVKAAEGIGITLTPDEVEAIRMVGRGIGVGASGETEDSLFKRLMGVGSR